VSIRKRTLLVTRLTIKPTVVYFAVSIIMMLYGPYKWLALAYGVIGLFSIIGSVGVYVAGAVATSSLRILKAIEILGERLPKN